MGLDALRTSGKSLARMPAMPSKVATKSMGGGKPETSARQLSLGAKCSSCEARPCHSSHANPIATDLATEQGEGIGLSLGVVN